MNNRYERCPKCGVTLRTSGHAPTCPIVVGRENTEETIQAAIIRETVFSPCRKWRYTLWREFPGAVMDAGINQMQEGFVQFIGLNPSTADETKDDPTIRRCKAFAASWGYGAMCMTNIFGWRDTDPRGMKKQPDPIGPDNDKWLLDVAREAKVVVAAWGTHSKHLYRGVKVKRMFLDAGIQLHCLQTTNDGHPQHPLYLPASLTPIVLP